MATPVPSLLLFSHDTSVTSSDLSFDLQLLLFTYDSLPPLTVTPVSTNLTLA